MNSKKLKTPGITRVKLIAHSRRVKRKIVTDIPWYDHETKTMKFFRGSRLEFEYKYDEEKEKKVVVPKPVIEETYVYRSSWEDIVSVIEENKRDISIVACHPHSSVTIEIGDDHFWYDIEKQLRALTIRYEIDDEDNS